MWPARSQRAGSGRGQDGPRSARATQATRRFPLWGHLLLCGLVLATALGLRLHRLGEESLWIDEAITYARATKAPDALIHDTLRRKHIPTYFLLMHHWLAVGDSEFALRLPSAVFSTGTCGVTYAIGAVAGGPVAGLVAGLLLAIAPAQLHYAQEARMYALLTLLSALSLLGLTLLALTPLERGRPIHRLSPAKALERRALLGFALAFVGTAGILWTHNTAIFFVAALQLMAALLWWQSPGQRGGFLLNWLLVMGACLLAWSPWIPHLVDQSGTFDRWKQKDLSRDLARDVLDELLLVGDPQGPLPWLLGASALLALAMTGPTRKHAWLFASGLLSALGLAALASVIKANMFFVRTLLWVAIPAYVLVGLGLSRLPKGSGLLVLVGLLYLTAPHTRDYYSTRQKPRWRDFLTRLSEMPEDEVIVGVRVSRFTYYYYNRRDDRVPKRDIRNLGRQKRLEDLVGDAHHFRVLAKRSAGRMDHLQYLLRKSKRYRRVGYERSGDALLMKYARIDGHK